MPSSTEVLNRVFDTTNGSIRTGQTATGGLTPGDGKQTVTSAGTRVALSSSLPVASVSITAKSDNTGSIVVGGATVVAALATRQGTPLNAGDTIAFNNVNLANIYLDSTVSGDGVTYTYAA